MTLKTGTTYKNNGMVLVYLGSKGNKDAFFRINDGTFVVARNTMIKEDNNITWDGGQYLWNESVVNEIIGGI
jgi:hypothetical protein